MRPAECCRLSFLLFQGLLVETLSSLGLDLYLVVGQKRRGSELQCLAWYGKLIALPTATEFGQIQG